MAKDFAAQLARYHKIAVDLGPFQAYLHGESAKAALTLPLFEHIEQGRLEAVTSMLTFATLLSEAYRAKDEALAQEFNFLLPTFPHLALVEVNQAIADRAAQLHARQGLSLDHALQLATARVAGAEVFVTTEAGVSASLAEMDVIVLENDGEWTWQSPVTML
ncbi:MAG TPA: PIN domain-containing protein [Oscillatoriaceae cyanobacterium]